MESASDFREKPAEASLQSGSFSLKVETFLSDWLCLIVEESMLSIRGEKLSRFEASIDWLDELRCMDASRSSTLAIPTMEFSLLKTSLSDPQSMPASSESSAAAATQVEWLGMAPAPALVPPCRLPPSPNLFGRIVATIGSLNPSPVGPSPVPGTQPRFWWKRNLSSNMSWESKT